MAVLHSLVDGLRIKLRCFQKEAVILRQYYIIVNKEKFMPTWLLSLAIYWNVYVIPFIFTQKSRVFKIWFGSFPRVLSRYSKGIKMGDPLLHYILYLVSLIFWNYAVLQLFAIYLIFCQQMSNCLFRYDRTLHLYSVQNYINSKK